MDPEISKFFQTLQAKAEPPESLFRKMERLTAEERGERAKLTEEKFGATGRHPEGKLTQRDEGEIRCGVTVIDGKVVLYFGQPVTWMGMTPAQSRDVGDLLVRRAAEAEGETPTNRVPAGPVDPPRPAFEEVR
jgi:hypothetical protein